MSRLNVRAVPLVALLLLTACASEPVTPPSAVNLSGMPPIKLDVMQVTVANEIQSPAAPPGVNPSLTDMVMAIAKARLQAQGAEGTAQLTIKEAVVTEEQMPSDDGISSWFERGQDKRWQAKVAADMTVGQPGKGYTGSASAYATRSTTIPEDATPEERQAAWSRIINGLTQDLNVELEKNIRTYLTPVVMP